MFGSIERSWNLAKESLGVIRKDPELMIFPIVSFIAGVIVAGILGTAAFFTDGFDGDRYRLPPWHRPGIPLLLRHVLRDHLLPGGLGGSGEAPPVRRQPHPGIRNRGSQQATGGHRQLGHHCRHRRPDTAVARGSGPPKQRSGLAALWRRLPSAWWAWLGAWLPSS